MAVCKYDQWVGMEIAGFRARRTVVDPAWQITDLWVRPRERRRGLARRLVERAQGWIRDQGVERVDPFEVVRTIAVARILMPRSYVRLSAGRTEMDESLQAMCLMAGANSFFTGDTLLTTGNPAFEMDKELLTRLGMAPESASSEAPEVVPVSPSSEIHAK